MTGKSEASHYTSTQGLISIIQNHKLWATSAAFMNDANEMRSGAIAFAEHFERIRHELTSDEISHIESGGAINESSVLENFLLSAASDADNLTLWRNYGVSEVAYSVTLDASIDLVPVLQRKDETHPSPPPGYDSPEPDDWGSDGAPIWFDPSPDDPWCFGGSWQEVVYITPNDVIVENQLRQDIQKYRERKSRGGVWIPSYDTVVSSMNFLKDASFLDEKEVRSVHWVKPWWRFVKYRPSRFGVVPYIEVSARSDPKADYATEATKLPILGVTIGPTATEPAIRALRTMLDDNGYGDAWVKRSVTPYR